ncbi:hypothetical protein [Lactobacillus johnsonii]|jgi:hypothetical protein|uniref:Uncharacterized protein n=1 Tax=Lactobacillus johnsonii TaxID=33959 RepID=A0A9W4E8Q4_LACJH|nr:hypothetical protein [Lactobacillus johnsonii]AZZ67110.1 hypothetical protein D7321_02910 [Lactobacillus johnsonii]MCI6882298.1 hypothetical protein [Lactobacillus johnsonii]MDY6043016.1 hypothetical protein [Lactobacillus johnsonii]QLL67890.1 hypothetical protein GTO82_03020 [Lactobacillus johnsonii]UOC06861.1 hypothetical protein LC811_03330 [Lactobacillus johnsonii]
MKIIEANEKAASRKERWIVLSISLIFGDLMNKLFLRLTSIDSFILSMVIGIGSMYLLESGYYYFRDDIQKIIEKFKK